VFDLLLIALPLLTAIGCLVVVLDPKRQRYTHVFFGILGAAFLWLFLGEFSLQYLNESLLADRFLRAIPFRSAMFVATWVFAIGSKLGRE